MGIREGAQLTIIAFSFGLGQRGHQDCLPAVGSHVYLYNVVVASIAPAAVLAAAFIGIYNLVISALPTSMLSGGLILPPLFVFAILVSQRLVARGFAHLKQY